MSSIRTPIPQIPPFKGQSSTASSTAGGPLQPRRAPPQLTDSTQVNQAVAQPLKDGTHKGSSSPARAGKTYDRRAAVSVASTTATAKATTSTATASATAGKTNSSTKSSTSGRSSENRPPAGQSSNSKPRPQTRLEREKKKDYKDPANIGPWKLGKIIGQGASGRVRYAQHGSTGQPAAVKIIPKNALVNSRMSLREAGAKQNKLMLGIEREIVIMKLIEHPNLIGLWDVYETSTELYLVMEYVAGGELFDHLVARGKLSSSEARSYFRQIIYGLDYCHRFNICHRDLKPENLLLDSKKRTVKLADFGMAALQPTEKMLETSCGSPHYASPEIVSGKSYKGSASDIWSCGIILFALLCGRLPFDDPNLAELLKKVRSGKFHMPEEVEPSAKGLIWRMLEVDPARRITMPDILRHPWFTNDGREPARNPVTTSFADLAVETARIFAGGREAIDADILQNLRTLWPELSEKKLIDTLLSPEVSWQKTFYTLLVNHRENHSADDDEDVESDGDVNAQGQRVVVDASASELAAGKAGVADGATVNAGTAVSSKERARPRRSGDIITPSQSPLKTKADMAAPSSGRQSPTKPAGPRTQGTSTVTPGSSGIATATSSSSGTQASTSKAPQPTTSFRASEADRTFRAPDERSNTTASTSGAGPTSQPTQQPKQQSPLVGARTSSRAPSPARLPADDLAESGTSKPQQPQPLQAQQQPSSSTSSRSNAATATSNNGKGLDRRLSLSGGSGGGAAAATPAIAVPQVGDATVQRFFQEIADELAMIRASGPSSSSSPAAAAGGSENAEVLLQSKLDKLRATIGAVASAAEAPPSTPVLGGSASVRSPQMMMTAAPSTSSQQQQRSTVSASRADETHRFDDADEDDTSVEEGAGAGLHGGGASSRLMNAGSSSAQHTQTLHDGRTAPLSISSKASQQSITADRSTYAGGMTSPNPTTHGASGWNSRNKTVAHSRPGSAMSHHSGDENGSHLSSGSMIRNARIKAAAALRSRAENASSSSSTATPMGGKENAAPSLSAHLQAEGLTRLQKKNPGLGLDILAPTVSVSSAPGSPGANRTSHATASPIIAAAAMAPSALNLPSPNPSIMSGSSSIIPPSPKQSWFAGLFNWKPASYTLYSIETLSITTTECRRLLHSYGVRTVLEDAESELRVGVLKCVSAEVRDPSGVHVVSKPVRFRVEFAMLPVASPSAAFAPSPALSGGAVPGTPRGSILVPASPALSAGGGPSVMRASSIRSGTTTHSYYSREGSSSYTHTPAATTATSGGLLHGFATTMTLVQEKGALSTFKGIHAQLSRDWELDMLHSMMSPAMGYPASPRLS
ncbi:hypothetical protein V8E36_005093 [Tilletia maclaganii]